LTHPARSSIALLLIGIGLIVGSCVPTAQTLWSAGSGAKHRLALTAGQPATLALEEDLSAIPVVRVKPHTGAAGVSLGYTFSISGPARSLVDERGTARLESAQTAAGDASPAVLRLRFEALNIPAGVWTVRFDLVDAADIEGLIETVELRLETGSSGLMPALITTLMLAILGWLAACLGALQWIRAEAASPAGADQAGEHVERARPWAVACHLSGLLGYLLPFGHVLGPLAVWLSKRREFAEVEAAGREALNFQLSITVYALAGLLLSFFLIGVVVLFALVVFHFTLVMYASLRAQRGLQVAYPLSIRFV